MGLPALKIKPATTPKKKKARSPRLSLYKGNSRVQVKRMTESKRIEELSSFVKLCFSVLDEENTRKQICTKSGLSSATIYRLVNDQYTMCVRFGTIQALGIAAGMQLKMDEYEAKVVLIK